MTTINETFFEHVNNGNLQAVEKLLDEGFYINARCRKYYGSALLLAITNLNVEMVKLLLERGISISDYYGESVVNEMPSFFNYKFLNYY